MMNSLPRSIERCGIAMALWLGVVATGGHTAWAAESESRVDAASLPYHERVLGDKPVAYWRFEGDEEAKRRSSVESNQAATKLPLLAVVGNVNWNQSGPRGGRFPLFAKDNEGAHFAGGTLRVSDPGESSPFDFALGDTITLETWVRIERIGQGQNIYLVGKGRTNNAGFPRDNQNFALRLMEVDGTARPSFLFRAAANRPGEPNDFHRWFAASGIMPGPQWHHVVVSYTFGKPQSVTCFLNGEKTKGEWDMGGPSAAAPVVDNDEVWLGGALGNSESNALQGTLDEVAIYRRALSAAQVASHYRIASQPVELSLARLTPGAVHIAICEGLPEQNTWGFEGVEVTNEYQGSVCCLADLPRKYVRPGVIGDRGAPFLVVARTLRTLPAGNYELLLRARNAARLFVDGKLVAESDFLNRNANGHEAVPELAEPQHASQRALLPGHQERRTSLPLAQGEHRFVLECIVGGKGLRPEIGEVCVALASEGGAFEVLTPDGVPPLPITDEAVEAALAAARGQIDSLETRLRHAAAATDDAYWQMRHQRARRTVTEMPPLAVPEPVEGLPSWGSVDHFLNARLKVAGLAPEPAIDDYAFLRRATLDIVGTLPSPAEVDSFLALPAATRRLAAIDRLLADARWADHWTGYWQDVLAENPGILKPELNNTGPFRYWLYEALLDNKPADRFVTELISLKGSKHFGGPAGFGMATQNDAPMAEKAHIVAQAFLAVEMKCARCHDAPYHPYTQQNLFQTAAMLAGGELVLPKTSTVPRPAAGRQPLVTSRLAPGDKLAPAWPFAAITGETLPEGTLRTGSERERLAALVTAPANARFAEVLANRLWKRYFGRGLVDPVDDWHEAEPSHPELLTWLGRELTSHDYNLKHVARLILSSHAYQRQAVSDVAPGAGDRQRWFAGVTRRRLSAEQVLDSLYDLSGKPLRAELLTMDPEARRGVEAMQNLGSPRRAWQFTSLSNERDRPALSLPTAQSMVDLLKAYGWRETRQSPLTQREEAPTPLQPLTLANGVAGRRASQLSDDSAFTRLALENQTVEELVRSSFVRILSRPPSEAEQQRFTQLLGPGFEHRISAAANSVAPAVRSRRHAVSWANHLSEEATRIKLELEKESLRGDLPTARLAAEWRERLEDMVWVLINSPEFMFVP